MQTWQVVPGGSSAHVGREVAAGSSLVGECDEAPRLEGVARLDPGLSPRSHEPIGPRLHALLPLLGCTECHGPLVDEGSALQCPRCGHRYRHHDGLMDFAPFVEPAGVAQRLVEGRTLSPVYQSLFRPLLQQAATQFDHSGELRWIERWFSDVDGAVLDLGCGGGRVARLLATGLDEAAVIGVDLDAPALLEAQRQSDAAGLPITYLRADAAALPLQDGGLAGVGCSMTLQLLADPGRAVAEVARVLAPGGRFVGVTIKPSGSPLLQKLEEHLSHTASVHLFGERELERLFEKNGLEPIELSRHGMVLLFAARRLDDKARPS